jgi:hypothetical protein
MYLVSFIGFEAFVGPGVRRECENTSSNPETYFVGTEQLTAANETMHVSKNVTNMTQTLFCVITDRIPSYG